MSEQRIQSRQQELHEAFAHAKALDLKAPADVAARLTLALESDGPAFMVAFRAIVWAWGLDDIATVCGMSSDELARGMPPTPSRVLTPAAVSAVLLVHQCIHD